MYNDVMQRDDTGMTIKIVASTIALSVLYMIAMLSGCSSGSSSGFDLRNDIHFGDSMEKVRNKESLGIKKESEDEDDASITYLTSEDGTIANIPDSYVVYSFKDDSLYKMSYTFGHYGTEDNSSGEVSAMKSYMNDQYDELSKTLTEKYGNPLSDDEYEKYEIVTGFIDRISNVAFFAALGADSDVIGAEEWLVECDNGSHVIITLMTEYIGGKTYVGYTTADYQLISEDQWNDILEKQKNMDADL